MDNGSEWTLRTDPLEGQELNEVRDKLEEASSRFKVRGCMCLPPIMMDYVRSNTDYIHSILSSNYIRENDRLVVSMKPDIYIERNDSSNGCTLNVHGTMKDMFGVNKSSQWFLDSIYYKINSVEVKKSNSSVSKNIANRVSINDIDIYSGRYYTSNFDTFSIKDEYYTVNYDDSTKTIKVKLNSFEEGYNYDGLKSIIKRYISRLDIYKLQDIPINSNIPLIIPFNWQVPLKKDEVLTEVRITIEMTAYQLLTNRLVDLNCITKGRHNIKTQTSQFNFSLKSEEGLHFNLDTIKRTTNDLTLNIPSETG